MNTNQYEECCFMDFIDVVEQACLEKETTCLLYTSSVNKSGRFFIKEGHIVKLGYAGRSDRKAIKLMSTIESVKYRYEKLLVDIPLSKNIPATDEIFSLIRGEQPNEAQSNEAQPESTSIGSQIPEEEKQLVKESLKNVIGESEAEKLMAKTLMSATSVNDIVEALSTSLDEQTFESFQMTLLMNSMG